MRAVMNFSLYRTGNFLQREIFGRVPSPISLSLSLSLVYFTFGDTHNGHRLGIYDAPGAFDIRDICYLRYTPVLRENAPLACPYFNGSRNRRFDTIRGDATRFPDTLLLQFVLSARKTRHFGSRDTRSRRIADDGN